MTDLERLNQKIASQAAPPGEAVVGLEDFFTGNNDLGSIGCNLGDEQPAIAEFYRILREIRSKPEVQDVLVRIYEFGDPSSWPYSDTVYILASASSETVEAWVAPLKPTEVHSNWMYGKPPKAPELAPGITAYSIWWD